MCLRGLSDMAVWHWALHSSRTMHIWGAYNFSVIDVDQFLISEHLQYKFGWFHLECFEIDGGLTLRWFVNEVKRFNAVVGHYLFGWLLAKQFQSLAQPWCMVVETGFKMITERAVASNAKLTWKSASIVDTKFSCRTNYTMITNFTRL